MPPLVVLLYGPPGSGKTTQAELLADATGLTYIDAGRFLESIVHDPKRQHATLIRRERKFFDSGKLLTTSFVVRELTQRIRHLHGTRAGIILSGNPRTQAEAVRILPLLEKLYGKRNIHIFSLHVPLSIAVRRNSRRRVCAVCGRPLLTEYLPRVAFKHCPVCAGKLYRRALDAPAVIKVRMAEYHLRTEPLFAYFRKRGLDVHTTDGTPSPAVVFKRIHDHLKNA